ncbi:MAG: GGDEF domain-containing protein [Nitrospirae bacterium]|nr:GGDEF domain-containing protein [Nitrospirota bacterium]
MEKKIDQELYKKLQKVNSALRIQKKKLLEEKNALKKWGDDLSCLNELSKAIVSTLDSDKIISSAAAIMQDIVPHDVFCVVLFKQKKLWVFSTMQLYVADTEEIKKYVLQTIKKVVETDDNDDYKVEINCIKTDQTESLGFNSKLSGRLCYPIEIGDTRIGALHLIRKMDKQFTGYEHNLGSMLVSTLALALRNSEIHREVKELATTDSLTGLFNNRYFYESLTRTFKSTMRYQNPVSLLMIDVDNFKHINDQHGHQAGDAVLHEISNRLIRSLREIDVPARYGGDEIAIILPETTVEQAFFAAKRLKRILEEQPVFFKEQNIRVTASFGVVSCPSPGIKSVDDMISVADKALYDAKKSGRNRIEVSGRLFTHDNSFLGPFVF